MTLEIDVLTLFPDMIDGPLTASIPGHVRLRGDSEMTLFGPGSTEGRLL